MISFLKQVFAKNEASKMNRFLWAVTLFLFISLIWTTIVEFGTLIFGDYNIYIAEDILNGIGSMLAATYFGLVLIELGK